MTLLLRNLQTSRTNDSRILRIKNAKFSWYYYFYVNKNIQENSQICISVPLISKGMPNFEKY